MPEIYQLRKRRPGWHPSNETPAHRAFIVELERVRARQKERKHVAPNYRPGRPTTLYEYQGERRSALEWSVHLGLARRESFYTRLSAYKAGRCELVDVFTHASQSLAKIQQQRRRERERASRDRTPTASPEAVATAGNAPQTDYLSVARAVAELESLLPPKPARRVPAEIIIEDA